LKEFAKFVEFSEIFDMRNFPDVNAGKSGERFAFDISSKQDSLIYYKLGFSSASFPGSVSEVVPKNRHNLGYRACQWEGGWVFLVFSNSDLVGFP
jgi:hypothetical protein